MTRDRVGPGARGLGRPGGPGPGAARKVWPMESNQIRIRRIQWRRPRAPVGQNSSGAGGPSECPLPCAPFRVPPSGCSHPSAAIRAPSSVLRRRRSTFRTPAAGLPPSSFRHQAPVTRLPQPGSRIRVRASECPGSSAHAWVRTPGCIRLGALAWVRSLGCTRLGALARDHSSEPYLRAPTFRCRCQAAPIRAPLAAGTRAPGLPPSGCRLVGRPIG